MRSGGRQHRLSLAAIAAGAVGALCGVVLAQEASYPRDPQTVVASYTLVLGELRDPAPGPSVRVYGDGRAVVHIPRYMKRAGDYEVRLSETEMNALISTLNVPELLQFDPAAVRDAKANSLRYNRGGAAGEPLLVQDTDPALTTIEMTVRPERAAVVSKKISWVGLESDARRFPDVPAIQKLAAAKQRLAALIERDDLVPVR